MHANRRHLVIGLLGAALVSLLAYASQPQLQREQTLERASADIPRNSAQRRLSLTAKQAAGVTAAAAVSEEDVGDVDSFKRAVRWLGVTQMSLNLSAACPLPGGDPDAACVTLNPAPASTPFEFEDLARIRLPGKAANSLLCYWLSPFLNVSYRNPNAPGGASVIARLNYSPTLTLENTVLDDPALIDPTTGLPFGGRLLTGMTASESFQVPLDAGVQITERSRDSAVCIAGFISRKALVQTYGLSEAQAREFFKRETMVRMNIRGNAQYVQDASLIFGFRIVGD